MKKINPTIQANYLNEFNYENRKKKREREREREDIQPFIARHF
jgi:hypothetical protein